jgi:hypothetical protein
MTDRLVARHRERIRRDLVCTHLPELAEDGYIEWDPETGEIAPGRRFDELIPLLESLDGPNDWPDD